MKKHVRRHGYNPNDLSIVLDTSLADLGPPQSGRGTHRIELFEAEFQNVIGLSAAMRCDQVSKANRRHEDLRAAERVSTGSSPASPMTSGATPASVTRVAAEAPIVAQGEAE